MVDWTWSFLEITMKNMDLLGSKAGHAANYVACRWAGAVMEGFLKHLCRCSACREAIQSGD